MEIEKKTQSGENMNEKVNEGKRDRKIGSLNLGTELIEEDN